MRLTCTVEVYDITQHIKQATHTVFTVDTYGTGVVNGCGE